MTNMFRQRRLMFARNRIEASVVSQHEKNEKKKNF